MTSNFVDLFSQTFLRVKVKHSFLLSSYGMQFLRDTVLLGNPLN